MEKNLNNFIRGLSLPYRGNCPKCGHNNTFSAKREGIIILFRCFHANCKLKGILHDNLTIDRISDVSFANINISSEKWIIPDYFTSPIQNSKSHFFMRRWGLVERYLEGVELYYDPKRERVVFPLRDYNKELCGATGRSLSVSNTGPRWYIYSRSKECPYIVLNKNSSICILVEDAISALNVGSICSSIALLGTNIPIGVYKYFSPYSKLVIALDADASLKAIRLQKELSLILPTSILFLKKDLKYFTKEELRKCLEL